MPIYEYEHLGEGCEHGKSFELKQSIYSDKFSHCPYCGEKVKRLISLVSVNTPKGNSDLKNLGQYLEMNGSWTLVYIGYEKDRQGLETKRP